MPIGKREDRVDVMLDQDDGLARAHFLEQTDQPLRFLATHTCGWLIEQKQLGPAHQGHGDFELPMLAVRQAPSVSRLSTLETDLE